VESLVHENACSDVFWMQTSIVHNFAIASLAKFESRQWKKFENSVKTENLEMILRSKMEDFGKK
jgi:hypothetical protein